jgi:EAL domain-containing protein (putative c-di-GMP-specific phosphodiesterase class I)
VNRNDSKVLMQRLSDALGARRRTGQNLLVLMIRVHPSERGGGGWNMTTQRGVQLELMRRLSSVVSAKDEVFGLEDASVIVLCTDVVGGEEARRVAEHFTREASQPSWDDSALPIQVSSGAVLAAARHASPESLLTDAEEAILRAAAGIGTQFAFSEGPLWSDLVTRLPGLDPAGDSDAVGFQLDYQPIVVTAGQSLWGIEALLRWEVSTPARRSAIDLVHVAEQTGWIESLGRWVMRKAALQAPAWAQAGATNPIVFVNASTAQLSSPRLLEDVDEILRVAGLAPQHLGFDISGDALGHEQAARNLQALRSDGVIISLDDFDMRINDIHSLDGMPLDHVKLDMSTVRMLGNDSADSMLVGTVVSAHRLGFAVTAKNIELQSQLAVAIEAKVDHLQGIFISPPVTGSKLDAFIATQHLGASRRLP